MTKLGLFLSINDSAINYKKTLISFISLRGKSYDLNRYREDIQYIQHN